jgi:hypothetical protein
MKVRSVRTLFLLPALAAGLAGLTVLPASAAQAAPSATLPRPASDQPQLRGAQAPISGTAVRGLTGRAARDAAGDAGVKFKEVTLDRVAAADDGVSALDWLHADWGVFVPHTSGTGLQVTQSVVPGAAATRGNDYVYSPTAIPPGKACMEIVTSYGPGGPAVWAWDWCGGRSGVGKSVPIDASFLATYTATVNGRPAYTVDQHRTDAGTNSWTSYLYNYTTHAWDPFFTSAGTWDLEGSFSFGWNMFEVYSNVEPSTGVGYYCTDFAGQSFESTGAKVLTDGAWVPVTASNSFLTSDPPPDGGALNCPALDLGLTHANDAWIGAISGSTEPPPAACTAAYRTVSSWGGGFQGEVTVTAGNAAISGWTVTLTWPSGQVISQVWNGAVTGTNQIGNVSHNGGLAAGASTAFGFLGNGSAATPALSCARS